MCSHVGKVIAMHTRTLSDRARVVHLDAGPSTAPKATLSRWVDLFVARALAWTQAERVEYSWISSYYCLSGLVADNLRRTCLVPHIAGFHTLALEKQLALPSGREPDEGTSGELNIVRHAQSLLAMSKHERTALIERYGATPSSVEVEFPGVGR